MAKLQDKFFNRVIEGDLELGEKEKAEEKARFLVELNDISNYEELTKEWEGTILVPSSLTQISPYCKAVRNFKELQFIFNIRLQNETESTIEISNDTKVCSFELPDDILSKIYAHSGMSLLELKNNGYDASIACSMLLVSTTASGMDTAQQPRYVNLYYVGVDNKVYFYCEGGAIGIESTHIRDLEARISLAL